MKADNRCIGQMSHISPPRVCQKGKSLAVSLCESFERGLAAVEGNKLEGAHLDWLCKGLQALKAETASKKQRYCIESCY